MPKTQGTPSDKRASTRARAPVIEPDTAPPWVTRASDSDGAKVTAAVAMPAAAALKAVRRVIGAVMETPSRRAGPVRIPYLSAFPALRFTSGRCWFCPICPIRPIGPIGPIGLIGQTKAHDMPRFAVILPAAGRSSRFQSAEKKGFADLDGQPVWLRPAEGFLSRPDVCQCLVGTAPEDREAFRRFGVVSDGRIQLADGGAERFESVANAL